MRATGASRQNQDQAIHHLGHLADLRSRTGFLRRNRHLQQAGFVERLCDEVVRVVVADVRRAGRLAESAAWLAARLRDPYCRGRSLRAAAHVLYSRREYGQALRRYKAAERIFRSLGDELQIGRTLSSAMQALIYLGHYKEAFRNAALARRIFQRAGDHLRLGRLEGNVGNVLYRQDRFQEALDHYRRAHDLFRACGEVQDVAIILRNIAVCHISLNEFSRALETYQQARAFSEQHRLSQLVLEADYNIAYLYFLRGEYTRAIRLYEAAREQCEKLEDRYHRALCDLDMAEMYLELNLSEEAGQLAEQAFGRFKQLGMGYEAAKALAFLAVSLAHQGKPVQALELFGEARALFVRERNHVWPALIDLHQALVLHREGRFREARLRCVAAARFFARSGLASKTALCELLLARLSLQAGQAALARRTCAVALQRLQQAQAPALLYQAYFVFGQIEEALGRRNAARESYRKAHAGLENMRSQLQIEELKIAFLKDKLALYESLVWLSLAENRGRHDPRAAFAYIEQAKSRSLADLISFRAHALPAPSAARSDWAERVRQLREELNWHYHRLSLEETAREGRTGRHTAGLRQRILELERELRRTLTDPRAADKEFSSLQNAETIPLEAIRTAIPPGALLLEYYQARGVLYVCLLSRDRLEIVPVSTVRRVRSLVHLLQFQLAKFRLGPEYVRNYATTLHEATQAHLHDLYAELLGTVRNRLQTERLILVPHQFLHYLPFHALWDGQRYLVDDFSISYAPSASVYYLCCTKPAPTGRHSLVMGVSDPRTPHILEEVRAVAAALPSPRVFTGEEATEERLKTLGPRSRFVHIATHGFFRQDNPMFSSIRLGKSHLSLFDLYNLRLGSELVTLSGCGTGLNVVVGGDELLGLVRGVLYAGAQAVQVTLWDVNDQSTAEYVSCFYRHLQMDPDKARAAQKAMQELRRVYPHPYYWAPFVLIGKSLPA